MLRFCRKLINVSCSTRGASSDEQASELSQGLSLLWYNIGPNVVLYSGVNWPILTQKIVRGKQLIWENNKMMRIKHRSVLCFSIEFLIYSFMLMIKLNMIYILIYVLPNIFYLIFTIAVFKENRLQPPIYAIGLLQNKHQISYCHCFRNPFLKCTERI